MLARQANRMCAYSGCDVQSRLIRCCVLELEIGFQNTHFQAQETGRAVSKVRMNRSSRKVQDDEHRPRLMYTLLGLARMAAKFRE
jgi:hypothetical protein